MSEINKPTTRNRGQRKPPKEKESPPKPIPRTIKRRSVSPPAISETLQITPKENPLLPTSEKSQDGPLDQSKYQTIAESGVLLASLKQSMERIKIGCLFEKYWTKSTKRKGPGDTINPDSKSMQKLGVCSMTIEPHSFEVTLYAVRNASLTFLPPVNQASIQRTGLPGSHYHSHIAPAQPSSGSNPQNFQPLLQANRPSFSSTTSISSSAGPSAVPPIASDQSHQASSAAVVPSPTQNQYKPEKEPLERQPTQKSTDNLQAPSQPSEAPSSTNPVIQMLAQRASTDANLKSLMKLVANGSASETQLKAFQRHIDELNSLLKSSQQPATQPNTLLATSTQSDGHTNVPTAPPPIQSWPTQSKPSVKQEPLSQYYSQKSQYVKPKASTSHRSDTSAIVFDISGGNGDRYLLPKKSILQYLPSSPEVLNPQILNHQVLMSFLVVRKGSEAHQGSYRSNTDYYQPLTIKLTCHHNKVLDPLAKVVEAPDVVRKYMEETMGKAKHAENVYLVTRLPKSNSDATERDEELSQEKASKEVLISYGPPDSLRSLKGAR